MTTREHWEQAWSAVPRWRLPSGLLVSTRNLQRLLRRHVRPGTRFVEIGCAPGKMLAWVAVTLGARVTGIDYSPRGIDIARELFRRLGIQGDLRCEDIFETTLEAGSFDIAYSAGLIEHFDDPQELVRRHLVLVRPGGLVLITIPNYRGLYGALQSWFDQPNLMLHNLAIMDTEALVSLTPPDLPATARAYPWGRLSASTVSVRNHLPVPVAFVVNHAVNALGLLQPVDIPSLSPMLVLEIRRRQVDAR